MLQSRQFLKLSPLRLACAGSCLAFACALAAIPAQAQQGTGGAIGQAMVQALPNNDSMNLNAALARLGRNPRDVQALIDAGQAALAIGDVDAAVGFFSRADQVTPGNPQVKAGLARALVRSGNPFDAIPLFDEAERAGAIDSTAALDRGLAFDLVADNASAQRYYRQALAAGPNDEAIRRLAISLAIAGDKRGSGTTLSPLLSRQDKAAWRTRAFALAIMGQADEAISVVNGTLPASLAAGIAPYLRYMPRLTPAQQAAAANFGQFPRASEIGQDDPRIARYATTGSRRTAVASADAGLIPKGEPLGRNSRGRDSSRGRTPDAARQRPPEVAVAEPVQPRVQTVSRAAPPIAQSPRGTATASAPLLSASGAYTPLARTDVPAARPVPPPATAPAPVPPPPVAAMPAIVPPAVASTPAIQPAPALRPAAAVASVAAPPAPAPPVPPSPRRMTLAEAFSDIARPAADATPASGAVDIRRIRPTRGPASGTATATLAPPSHPSRIWVQLATGRDRTALAYDWRRIARAAEAAFKSRRPSISAWGQSNRLLAGPFESEAAANAFLGQLRRASVDGAFVWTSPAGQVVDALGGR